MMRLLSLLVLGTLALSGGKDYTSRIEYKSPALSIEILAPDGVIAPNDPVSLTAVLEVKETVNMVVLVVPITRRADYILDGAGWCEQPYTDLGGGMAVYDNLICVLDHPKHGITKIQITVPPVGFVLGGSECRTDFVLGISVWAALNGQQIIPEGTKIEMPYQPGYCLSLPMVMQ